MKRWLAMAWTWSAVVTLPVAVVFFAWVTGTFRQWKNFALDYDARPAVIDLHEVGEDNWRGMLRGAELALSPTSLASLPPDRGLRTIQLFVGESQLAALNRNLPYSGFEFQDGQLMFPDGLREVSVRYRGDFLVHWGFEKKSIRIRTKDKQLFEGMQAFNLIAPKFAEQVNNYLGYRLAGELGLMAPHSELVNLVLNGRNVGVHALVEQIDEGTLRRHGQAVGEIFVGDLISKDKWDGIENHVFELPELWTQLVDDKNRIPGSRAPLDRLLHLLAEGPSEDSVARLAEMLDLDAFGAFSAFELLTQSHHYDNTHNWRLAWDPWTQKFRPVVWDPTPWAFEMRPPDGEPVSRDLVVSQLAIWLHRSGAFLAARHAALRAFFTSGRAEQFLAEVDATLARTRLALAYDPNIRPTDPAVIADGMQTFRAFIAKTFRELRAAYLEPLGEVRWSRLGPETLALEVTGRRPVESVVLRCDRMVQRPKRVLLRCRRYGRTFDTDLTGGVLAQGTALHIPTRLFQQYQPCFRYLASQVMRLHTLVEVPGYYELVFEGLADQTLTQVSTLRGDGEERATPCDRLTPLDLTWINRPTEPQPSALPQVWRGTVTVQGQREIAEEVVIEPGTTIALEAGATLVFRGRVTAQGTREQPIRFVPNGAGAYGAVALVSPRAEGSTFRNCEWRGGAGATTGTRSLPGMLSIHDCADVELTDCRFADDAKAPAQLHLGHARARLRGVEWLRASGDGLRSDLSRLELDDCRVENAGGACIALTTSTALIGNGNLAFAKGAALRAEARSSVVAVRTKLRRSEKGADVRDESVVDLVNCELLANKRSLSAEQKNWRFPGGAVLQARKSLFSSNESLPSADAKSSLTVLDCMLDAADKPALDPSRKAKDNHARFVDSDGGAAPKQQAPLPFLPELQALEPAAQRLWSTVRPEVRGGRREQ